MIRTYSYVSCDFKKGRRMLDISNFRHMPFSRFTVTVVRMLVTRCAGNRLSTHWEEIHE